MIESRESSRLQIAVAEFESEWVINLHRFETVVNRNVTLPDNSIKKITSHLSRNAQITRCCSVLVNC